MPSLRQITLHGSPLALRSAAFSGPTWHEGLSGVGVRGKGVWGGFGAKGSARLGVRVLTAVCSQSNHPLRTEPLDAQHSYAGCYGVPHV